MKNPSKGNRFEPERYHMMFCRECGGSGESFTEPKGNDVCKVCGGFGLIKKPEKTSVSDKRFPIVLLR